MKRSTLALVAFLVLSVVAVVVAVILFAM